MFSSFFNRSDKNNRFRSKLGIALYSYVPSNVEFVLQAAPQDPLY